ncbi:aromatic prenyltransferase [Actinomadura oligospora]|uniref:aromatic prenyltransferase n=1 Tax=Actinomadura oligospora TaxID=111804 RepID=UPI0004BB8021|nr:aromatic prenyltransferase [Actinomadura oligospora]
MAASHRFSPEQFLLDAKMTADAIGAPFSETATRAVLDAYPEGFRDGAVLFRTTDVPGAPLNYRFYERRPTDSIGTAVRAGLLDADHPLISLISSWSSLYGDASTELVDFDAGRGIAKTWVFLGGKRPVGEVLHAPGVPEALLRDEERFRALGLTSVRHVAVDYLSNTANLYFRTSKRITPDVAEGLISLADGNSPTPELLADMMEFTPRDGHTFNVTVRPSDGEVQRVGVYALNLPEDHRPALGDRLTAFFRVSPSRDDEEMSAVAWSFGRGGRDYVKGEHGYSGRVVELMRSWDSPLTASPGPAIPG